MNLTIDRPTAERLQRVSAILFLDCDGVMNTLDWCREHAVGLPPDQYFTDFAPHTVTPLNRILNTCNVGIVVSSAWRLAKRNDLPAILERNGVDRARERFLGRTPDLSNARGGVVFGRQRGDEIRAWLVAVGFTGPFAAIDDANDLDAVADHHFKTDVRLGLTDAIADAVIAHFRRACT